MHNKDLHVTVKRTKGYTPANFMEIRWIINRKVMDDYIIYNLDAQIITYCNSNDLMDIIQEYHENQLERANSQTSSNNEQQNAIH